MPFQLPLRSVTRLKLSSDFGDGCASDRQLAATHSSRSADNSSNARLSIGRYHRGKSVIFITSRMNLANLHFLLRTLSWLIKNGPSSLRRGMRLDVFPSETRSREKLKHFPAFLGTLFIRTKKLTTFSRIYENIIIYPNNAKYTAEKRNMYSFAIFHPISKWSPALVGMDTFSHIAAGPQVRQTHAFSCIANWFAGVGWLTEFETRILPNQNCWMGSRSDWFNLTWNNGTYYIYDGLWHKRHQDHQEKQRNTLNVWTYP